MKLAQIRLTFSKSGDMLEDVRRIQRESDFSRVVADGINAIQREQKRIAPVGQSGRGPHGRIARSILPAKIYIRNDGSAEGVSRTTYGPAIFTNEGTGSFSPGGRPYFIPRPDWGKGEGLTHPGIRGTGWWERGANLGSPLALRAFQNKVERMLRIRGRA